MTLDLRAAMLALLLLGDTGQAFTQDVAAASGRLSELTLQLDSEDAREVDAALRQLAAMGHDSLPAITAMLSVVDRRDRRLVGSLHHSLMAIGEPAVAPIAAYLAEHEGHGKWQLLAVLRELGPRAAASVPTLISLVDPRNQALMTQLERTVASIGEAAVSPVLSALPTAAPASKPCLIRMVGRMGWVGAAATPDFLELQKKSEDLEVRLEATRALFGIAPHSVLLPMVAASLEDEEPQLRALAADVVLRLGDAAKGTRPKLLVALRDDHAIVAEGALEALLELGPDAGELLEALKDPETVFVEGPIQRLLDMRQLMFPGEPESLLQALMTLLKDERESKRLASLRGLSAWGPDARKAGPDIAESLLAEGRSEAEQLLGMSSLETLGVETALTVDTLRAALSSPHPNVRCQAAERLGELASDSKSVRKALKRAGKDSQAEVADAAAAAWAKIEQRSAAQ